MILLNHMKNYSKRSTNKKYVRYRSPSRNLANAPRQKRDATYKSNILLNKMEFKNK